MNNSLEDIISKIKAGKDLDDIAYKPSKIKAGKDLDDIAYKPSKINNSVSVQPKLEKIEVEKPKELTSGSGNTFNSLMQTSDKLDAQDKLRNEYISNNQSIKNNDNIGNIIGVIVAISVFGFFIIRGLYQIGVLK
jgi:hypothetical protein